jgi:anti-sigma-K factor RskA
MVLQRKIRLKFAGRRFAVCPGLKEEAMKKRRAKVKTKALTPRQADTAGRETVWKSVLALHVQAVYMVAALMLTTCQRTRHTAPVVIVQQAHAEK